MAKATSEAVPAPIPQAMTTVICVTVGKLAMDSQDSMWGRKSRHISSDCSLLPTSPEFTGLN
jgi:hypothetical protein